MGDSGGYRSAGKFYKATPEELQARKEARQARKAMRETTAELRKTHGETIKEWMGLGEGGGVGEYKLLKDWQGRTGRPSDTKSLGAKEKKVLAIAQKETGLSKEKAARFLDLATSALKSRLAYLMSENYRIGIDYTEARRALGIGREGSKAQAKRDVSYKAGKVGAKTVSTPRVLMQNSPTERWVARKGVTGSLEKIQAQGRWLEDVVRQEKVGGKWKNVD